jgi:tetratricopeptide (TPR) repeat protein
MEAVKVASIIFVAALCATAMSPQAPSLPASAGPVPGSSLETVIAQGWGALTGGRYEEAASRFRLVLARRSDASEALFGLGIACGRLGRLPEAREALERYVRLQPSAADGHSALGLVLLAAGKRVDARTELERALRLEPQNLEAAKALAHIDIDEYHGLRAVALLKPFAASAEFDDEARRLLAAGYAQTGDHRTAISVLGPALDRRPPPAPEAFILVISSALRVGDKDYAERACDLGLRLYLNSDEIEQRCLHVVSMDFIQRVESTLRGSTEDVRALILMGRLLAEIADSMDQANQERCITLLDRAVALSPADPVALFNLGRGLRLLARPEQAIPMLKRALAANPTGELPVLIWTEIGLAEQKLSHDAAAEDAFGHAQQSNRGLARHMVASAFIYHTFLTAENEKRQAGEVLSEILGWNPAFLPARMEHARMLAEQGHVAEAAGEAEMVATNADPADLTLLRAAHVFLLQLYKRMGRAEEAARHLAWLNNARAASAP